VVVSDASGDYELFIWAVEHHFGKTVLHLEFDTNDDFYEAIHFEATIQVTKE